MTLPLSQSVPPVQPAPTSSVCFPLNWFLANVAGPLSYRAAAEIARLGPDELKPLSHRVYAFRPALRLAVAQRPGGGWGDAMLAVPAPDDPNFTGVGTITAVRRLLEYGWDPGSPPIYGSRRLLFRLLAEDNDPAFLFDLAAEAGTDEVLIRRGRQILREAAAATLAQAGHEGDPRLRGAARRIVERLNTFLKSPDAAKPWIRVGNKHVLPADASPPSIYALVMLAHMPLFRNENHEQMDRLYNYLTLPLPRQEPVQIVGEHMITQPHYVLGDQLPHRNAADADVPSALGWLELVARLNFLRRNENWSKLFERFVDECDRNGLWRPPRGNPMPETSNPYTWPMFPLGQPDDPSTRAADVTFRIGLIARLSGRKIDLR